MVELKRTLKDDGVWITYEDAKLKIVHPESRKAQLQIAQLYTINEMHLIQDGEDAVLEYYSDLPAIEFARKEAKLAAFCVVDWEGFTADGVPIDYDIEVLIDWLIVEGKAKLRILKEVDKFRNPKTKSKTKAIKKKPKKS